MEKVLIQTKEINEYFEPPVVQKSSAEIEINLENVISINSMGIRLWINWITSLGGRPIFFCNCRPVMIRQANFVSQFFPPSSLVLSMYAPYFNERTGDEKDILLTYGKDYDSKGVYKATEFTDELGLKWSLDTEVDRYFSLILRKGDNNKK